jgi:allantoinase
MRWKSWKSGFIAVLALLVASHVLSGVALAQDGTDWVTKFPREPAQVSTWPGGKKVAVSFALFVEVFGFGQARSSARTWRLAIPTS